MLLRQTPKSDRKQAQQLLAVLGDPGTADRLLVRLTWLRKGLDEDANAQRLVLVEHLR